MTLRMTEEERRLLKPVLAKGAEDSGMDQKYAEEALRQLRGVISFLEQKYPDAELVYHMFDPQIKTTERGFLLFSQKGSSSVYRAVLRYADGEYAFADTLYSAYVSSSYDASLAACLSRFVRPVQTKTVFSTPAGREVNGKTPPAEILAHRPPLVRHTDIWTETPFLVTEELVETLRKEGFTGAYSLYCGEETERSYEEFSVHEDRKGETG